MHSSQSLGAVSLLGDWDRRAYARLRWAVSRMELPCESWRATPVWTLWKNLHGQARPGQTHSAQPNQAPRGRESASVCAPITDTRMTASLRSCLWWQTCDAFAGTYAASDRCCFGCQGCTDQCKRCLCTTTNHSLSPPTSKEHH